MLVVVILVLTCSQTFVFSFPNSEYSESDQYHQNLRNVKAPTIQNYDKREETETFWRKKGEAALNNKLNAALNKGIAKNVIFFIGDGMSIPTLAATRLYLAQQEGISSGEEFELSFEKFPYVGLSKTYCVDAQVPDSACTATAYLCGIKNNKATIGVTAAVPLGGCEEMNNKTNHVYSVTRLSQLAGKRTGIVTTTRITHASPAGAFGHTCDRNWESDADVAKDNKDPKTCRDLAHQLVHGETGSEVNVFLGGGTGKFIRETDFDASGKPGERLDDRNLLDEWHEQKQQKGASHKLVANRDQLLSLPADTEYVLGLFDNSHMPDNLKRNKTVVPSLTEMTETAIRLLSSSDQGYFLFVEGGLIDMAHHGTKPHIAIDETAEFHKAIEAAVQLTNSKDTLIVVSADHAHTMSISGYSERGHDIFGLSSIPGDDSLPFTTLSYANGPGYRSEIDGKRHDMAKEDLTDIDTRYPAWAPLSSETHGGDDVGIYAYGPFAHLFSGVNEQSFIPYAIKYASCLDDKRPDCPL